MRGEPFRLLVLHDLATIAACGAAYKGSLRPKLWLTVRSLESRRGLVVLRSWQSLGNLSHAPGHPDCFHKVLLVGNQRLNVIKRASDVIQQAWHRQDLVALGPLGCPDLQAAPEHLAHVLTVVARDGIVLAREHLRVQALHRLRPKWRHLHDHFIQDAAGAPYVRPVVVGLVLPDLGARIVRSASLSTHHPAFGNARYVHVAELDDTVLGQEDVRTLDVSVADSEVMKGLEPANDLDKEVPNLLFSETCIALLMVIDHHEQVSSVCVFHDDAESVRLVLEEGLLVADDIGVVHGCQNADLIEGILFFFGGEFAHFDFFHGIDDVIRFPTHAVNLAERALT